MPSDAQWQSLADAAVDDLSKRYTMADDDDAEFRRGVHRESNASVAIHGLVEADYNDERFEVLRLEVTLLQEARKVAIGGAAPLRMPYLHEVVRTPGRVYLILAPRRGAEAIPRMVENGAGDGVHDVYGFERVELPLLKSGTHLHVLEAEVGKEEAGTVDGAGIWNGTRPAVATMCRWLLSASDEMRGATVLELGAGTHGLCGLFAAGLGASRVLLTDGEPPDSKLFALLQENIERNRHVMAANCVVSCAHFRWAAEEATSLTAKGAFDWILGSDVSYLGIDHDELLSTLRALLSPAVPGSSRPPRVALAHEHRTRDLALLRVQLDGWLDGDTPFGLFVRAAERWGLSVKPLACERTSRGELRGQFCHWGYDVSVFEVLLAVAS